MDVLLSVFLASAFLIGAESDGFGYERMNYFGKGKRVIPPYKNFLASPYAYPAALPAQKLTSIEKMDTPFENLYQGTKTKGNVRVYNKKFHYNPQPLGHLVTCRGDVPCKISYLAIETEGGIPIILGGGVGYFYFDVVVKAKPYDPLVGRVRAWCNNETMVYS